MTPMAHGDKLVVKSTVFGASLSTTTFFMLAVFPLLSIIVRVISLFHGEVYSYS